MFEKLVRQFELEMCKGLARFFYLKMTLSVISFEFLWG